MRPHPAALWSGSGDRFGCFPGSSRRWLRSGRWRRRGRRAGSPGRGRACTCCGIRPDRDHLVLAVTSLRARRRGEPWGAAGSRWVRTGCAVMATAVLAPPLLLCAYRVGEQLSWWNSTAIDLAVRTAVLVAPPDAVLVLLVGGHGAARVGVAGARVVLARARPLRRRRSGAVQLVGAAPRPGVSRAAGISFGFTPFAEVLSSHHFHLHGLPGVLLIASLAVTAACVIIPSHRQPAETGRASAAAG